MRKRKMTLTDFVAKGKDTSLLKDSEGLVIANSLKPQLEPTAEGCFAIENRHVNFVLVNSGEADLVINSENLHVKEDTLIIMTANTTCDMRGFTADFELQYIDMRIERLMKTMSHLDISSTIFSEWQKNNEATSMNGEVPPMLMIERQHYVLELTGPEANISRHIFLALWQATQEGFDETARHLLAGLIKLGYQIYLRAKPELSGQDKGATAVLNRFLFLVHQHCNQHRTLDFYAKELCINKNYMSMLISSASQTTASKWVEIITLQKIKSLLTDTNFTIYQIADCMSFQEVSNLSRFFRRLTGMTPSEYRRSMGNAENGSQAV